MRQRIKTIVESNAFQALVLGLILVNAIILGAETLPGLRDRISAQLALIDRLIIYAFTLEILMRLYVARGRYFRSGWNIFDFLIVAVSLTAATSGLAALRAFRVLRVLRVITVFPRMRLVVSALLDAIPGIASVGVIVLLIVYVFAVIASNLYGGDHEALFGDVFTAMYTLFQVMTLEGWAEIAFEVAETHPNSWIFFLAFVLVATFTMLNLFVAIVVRVVEEDAGATLEEISAQNDAMARELTEIKAILLRHGDGMG